MYGSISLLMHRRHIQTTITGILRRATVPRFLYATKVPYSTASLSVEREATASSSAFVSYTSSTAKKSKWSAGRATMSFPTHYGNLSARNLALTFPRTLTRSSCHQVASLCQVSVTMVVWTSRRKFTYALPQGIKLPAGGPSSLSLPAVTIGILSWLYSSKGWTAVSVVLWIKRWQPLGNASWFFENVSSQPEGNSVSEEVNSSPRETLFQREAVSGVKA